MCPVQLPAGPALGEVPRAGHPVLLRPLPRLRRPPTRPGPDARPRRRRQAPGRSPRPARPAPHRPRARGDRPSPRPAARQPLRRPLPPPPLQAVRRPLPATVECPAVRIWGSLAEQRTVTLPLWLWLWWAFVVFCGGANVWTAVAAASWVIVA